MHEYRLCHLIGIVEDMYLLQRSVTTVHIVKLNIVYIYFQVTERKIIRPHEILNLADHYTLHRQHKRFFAHITVYGYLLMEMSECLSIINSTHREVLTYPNSLRKRSRRTPTTCLYILNSQGLKAFILQFELCLDRLFEEHLPHINNFLVGIDTLGMCRKRCTEQHAAY